MGKMSTFKDTMSEPMEENSVITDQVEPTEKTLEHAVKPTVKSKKLTQQSYRQKLQAVQLVSSIVKKA